MSTFTPFLVETAAPEDATTNLLRWRSWPLVEQPRWSWVVPAGILVVAGAVAYISESWMAGLLVAAVLIGAQWQYFVPVQYEVHATGIRRRAVRRIRTIPWYAVRAYRPLASGVVLYQRPDPTPIDALRAVFVPFPPDQDELLCALREHLGHAAELA
jgi:hypothetical protein